jgi:hypothetical protein
MSNFHRTDSGEVLAEDADFQTSKKKTVTADLALRA